jgi:hypothetical protein
MTWDVEPDRSLLGFARAIRNYPRLPARLAGVGCFAAVMVVRSGLESAGEVLAIALGIAVVIGYPIWRITGARR